MADNIDPSKNTTNHESEKNSDINIPIPESNNIIKKQKHPKNEATIIKMSQLILPTSTITTLQKGVH